MNPQVVANARRSCLKEQTQYLIKLDDRGHRVINEETGEPVVNLERTSRLLASIGVPPLMIGAKFDRKKFSEADAVSEWNTGVLDRLTYRYLALLFGPGSNYTAAAIVTSAVKRSRTVAWYSWHDFTRRYTDSIDRSRVLSGGLPEDAAEAAQEYDEARDEDFYLRHVYDVLVITDVDLDDVRDFAVPDIVSMFRNRSDYLLTTVLTVSSANSPDFERNADLLGKRGALLRLFEDEGARFDAR